jgi:uncharacterized SAM-binding protein YcdF (DUF218 family)
MTGLDADVAAMPEVESSMIFILKPLVRTLILPPAGPMLLAIVGFMLLRRRPHLGRSLIAIGIAALWLLATPVIADALLRAAERCPPLDLSRQIDAQAIVVLGGGGHRLIAPEYGGPAVDDQLLERITYTAFVAKRTGLPVLVCGAAEEAIAMQATLERSFDVPVRWVENRSRDTYENARLSAPILKKDGATRVLLVTSSSHMWRAAQEFRRAGIVVTPAPAVLLTSDYSVLRWIPTPTGLVRAHAALYELIGENVRQVLVVLHIRD